MHALWTFENWHASTACIVVWNVWHQGRIFLKHNFVSSHMYPENPEGTQVIVSSMNMYIYPTLPGIELTTCSVPSGSWSQYATVTDAHYQAGDIPSGWECTGYPVLFGIWPGIRYPIGSGILYRTISDIIRYPVESQIRYYPVHYYQLLSNTAVTDFYGK